MNATINKYGINLRLVEDSDAGFIVKLRTDETLGKFISKTSASVSAQKEWIKNYKIREAEGVEFYFIVSKDGVDYGTVRIYDIHKDCFETGSWVFLPSAPESVPILGGILCRELAFEEFPNAKYTKFSVRKKNKKVLRYHKMYGPELVGEDDENLFFHLTKEKWLKGKNKFLNLLGL